MRTEFDIVGSFGKQSQTAFDAERSLNCFEFTDKNAKRGRSLAPTPGLLAVNTMTLNRGYRGTYVFNGNAYVVIGENVYLVTSNLFYDHIGTLNTFEGQVDIEANTFQIMFVDGVNGYIFDTSTSMFSVLSGNGFPGGPLGLAYLDGFFLVAIGGTSQFVISQLNDGTTWDNLPASGNIASVTSYPGTITCLKTLHRRLFIFSQNFCEVWENAGLANFPLRRNNSLLLEFGTISKASVVSAFDRLFFLANSADGFGHIMMVVGTETARISTQALDAVIQEYAVISDATGLVNLINGIVFYRLNFTNANATWVFNVSQSAPEDLRWHEELMEGENRHVAEVALYFNQTNYVGDYSAPILYEMDGSYLTNNGEPILRERIPKQFFAPINNKNRIDRILIDMVQGDNQTPANSVLPGTDANPQLELTISRDGGVSYGNALDAAIGPLGQRVFRTIYRKLGTSRTFTFRFRCYNSVKFWILGMILDYETLPE